MTYKILIISWIAIILAAPFVVLTKIGRLAEKIGIMILDQAEKLIEQH